MTKKYGNRQSEREALSQTLTFEMSGVLDGRLRNTTVRGLCRDVSSVGMGIVTPQPLREGDVLKLHVPLRAVRADLPVYAEVVWSRSDNGNFRSGLRFLS